MQADGRTGAVEWSAALRPMVEGSPCGDDFLAAGTPGRRGLAVADGLRHGPHAALASRAAMDAISEDLASPLPDLVTRCHQRLAKTRGAALSLAVLGDTGLLEWLAIGNVEA